MMRWIVRGLAVVGAVVVGWCAFTWIRVVAERSEHQAMHPYEHTN